MAVNQPDGAAYTSPVPDNAPAPGSELEAAIARTIERIGTARRRQDARQHPLAAALRSDVVIRWKRRLVAWRR